MQALHKRSYQQGWVNGLHYAHLRYATIWFFLGMCLGAGVMDVIILWPGK